MRPRVHFLRVVNRHRKSGLRDRRKRRKRETISFFVLFLSRVPFLPQFSAKRKKKFFLSHLKKIFGAKERQKKRRQFLFFPLCPNLMMMELSCNFCVPTELSSLFLRENAVSKEGSHVTSYERFCSSPSPKVQRRKVILSPLPPPVKPTCALHIVVYATYNGIFS